jgi:tetratricopeptide (TPR) repeat protein
MAFAYVGFSVKELIPGQIYRVIQPFTDHDGVRHPVSPKENWYFTGFYDSPQDEIITLYLQEANSIEREQNLGFFRLSYKNSAQKNFIEDISLYLRRLPIMFKESGMFPLTNSRNKRDDLFFSALTTPMALNPGRQNKPDMTFKKTLQNINRVIKDPGKSPAEQASALLKRAKQHSFGMVQTNSGHRPYRNSTVFNCPDAPPGLRALAAYYCGVYWGLPGDLESAMNDYTRIIGMDDIPGDIKGYAYVYRAFCRTQWLKESSKAEADYSLLIDRGNKLPLLQAFALISRAGLYRAGGEYRRALKDLKKAASVEGCPADYRAKALYASAGILRHLGQIEESEGCIETALGIPDISVEFQAKLLYYRAEHTADEIMAEKCYTEIIALQRLCERIKLRAYLKRGNVLHKRGYFVEAIPDYSAFLYASSGSIEEKLKCLKSRSFCHHVLGDGEDVKRDNSLLEKVEAVMGIPVNGDS